MNKDALEQYPCNTCGYEEGSIYCKEHCPHEAKIEQNPSGDAISRKIISAFLSGLISDETERKKALEYINELPSVNPQPCEDAISRQAVCKIIDDIRDCVSVNGYWAFLERLKKLPSVNPTKTGHWIDRSEGGRIKYPWMESNECSKCGENGSAAWNYCPNCGAKMIEPQERSGEK